MSSLKLLTNWVLNNGCKGLLIGQGYYRLPHDLYVVDSSREAEKVVPEVHVVTRDNFRNHGFIDETSHINLFFTASYVHAHKKIGL